MDRHKAVTIIKLKVYDIIVAMPIPSTSIFWYITKKKHHATWRMEVVVMVMVTTADMCSAFRYCRVASNWV